MLGAELDNDGIRDDFPHLVRGTGNFPVEDLFCLPVRDDLAHAVFRVGSRFNRGEPGKESCLGSIGIVGCIYCLLFRHHGFLVWYY